MWENDTTSMAETFESGTQTGPHEPANRADPVYGLRRDRKFLIEADALRQESCAPQRALQRLCIRADLQEPNGTRQRDVRDARFLHIELQLTALAFRGTERRKIRCQPHVIRLPPLCAMDGANNDVGTLFDNRFAQEPIAYQRNAGAVFEYQAHVRLQNPALIRFRRLFELLERLEEAKNRMCRTFSAVQIERCADSLHHRLGPTENCHLCIAIE